MKRTLSLTVVFLFGSAIVAFGQRPQRPGAAVAVKPAAEPAKPAEEAKPAAEAAKEEAKPEPEAPKAEAPVGKLEILITSLPDAEVGRWYKPELQARGGKGSYGWSSAEGSEVKDECDAEFCFRPEKEGTYKVILEVSDSSEPALKATKAFSLKVGPRQFHGEDITELEKGLGNKATVDWVGRIDGRLDTVWNILTSNELDKNFETNRFIKLEADLKEAKETVASLKRLSWSLMFIFIVIVALATGVIIIRRRRAATPAEPTSGTGMPRVTPMLLIGALALSSLISVPPAIAAPAAATPDPAKPAITGLSVSADYVLAGAEVQDPKTKEWKPRFYTLSLGGKNLEGVEAVLVPTGCTVEGEPKMTKTSASARFRCDNTAPEGRNQAGLKIKGEDVFPPDNVFFLIFSQTSNSMVEYLRARAADPAARHYLQARFQLVYGKEEGQKRYDAYRRKPTHQVVQELEAARQRKLLEDAANVATTRLAALEAKVAELDQTQRNLQASVEDGLNKANSKTEGVERQVAELRTIWGEELGRTQEAVRDLGNIVADVGDQRVKKGGFLGFGGTKPLDPKIRERVERALAKLK